jgi:hypothetical protein
MSEILINRLTTQLSKSVDEHKLRQWEQSTAYTLPKDYRSFINKYNGGMIKPWIFRHDHPQVVGSDREMLLDYLRDWQSVVEISHLDTPPDLATLPPGHIDIGRDPGGGRILLSLRPQDHGNVVYWLPSYMHWGEEPNNVVGFIARSFTEFLNGLFDDGETEHGNWDVVARKRPPVPLVL